VVAFQPVFLIFFLGKESSPVAIVIASKITNAIAQEVRVVTHKLLEFVLPLDPNPFLPIFRDLIPAIARLPLWILFKLIFKLKLLLCAVLVFPFTRRLSTLL
jgi:hypothetical protein